MINAAAAAAAAKQREKAAPPTQNKGGAGMGALPCGWEGEAHLACRSAFGPVRRDSFKCYRLSLFKTRSFRWRQP